MVDLKNLFGGLLDRDGDGDVDLNDIMGLLQDPSALGNILGGGATDGKGQGLDKLLSGAIENIALGTGSNDAQSKLEQVGISAGSIGDLIGGLLGKDTSTNADKSTLDTMLSGALTSLTGAKPKTQNQGNQMLDMIVKIVGSKLASDALTGVVKSFMGNVMTGVKQGAVAQETKPLDVVGELTNALSANKVDKDTTNDIVSTVLSQLQNLVK